MGDIPIIDSKDGNWKDELRFALMTTGSSSDYRNDRERPYNGQPWTDEGIRGKAPVVGLTFRDIKDCFIKGFLLCCGVDQPELYKKVQENTWRVMDIFKVDLSHIDPLAACQNMGCEIEKVMGVYPNCPPIDTSFLEDFEEEP